MICDKAPQTVPSRWMGLDIGSKRIGVAISDLLKMTARPLLTLQRESPEKDVQRLLELAQQQNVSLIVVGRPLKMSGARSEILDLVERFADELAERSALRFDWVDERLSTKEAEALMSEHGVKVAERRGKRDQYAAALILTWYLEERAGGI